MKNKFVTAVTAASLLATIFGSSVMAAGRPPKPVTTGFPIAKYTTIPVEGNKLTQAGTTAAFGFYSVDATGTIAADDAQLTYTFFVAGAAGSGTTKLETADLKAVSSNSNILVAWAYSDDGDSGDCSAIDTTGTFVTTDIVEGVEDGAPGEYSLCVAAKTATTAATGTITVYASKAGLTASSWVNMKTVTVTAVGPLAKLELSLTDSYKYVAGDNAAIEMGLTLVGKDANGTVLNGATDSITGGAALEAVALYTNNPENANEDPIAFFDDNSGQALVDAESANNGSLRLYDIEANTCAAGNGDEILSDAGKSYNLKVQDDETGDIVSNSITITCTGDGGGAVVKSAAAEVTSFTGRTYDDGLTGGDDQFNITATIVDENGLPLGNGATTDFGDVTLATGITALHFSTTGGDGDVVNGKLVIAEMAPAALLSFKTYKYSIKVADSDLAKTTAVAKTFSFSYTISNPTTITVKMNAAKTVATVTVNFGEDAADQSAYLTVETATGKETVYRKIANASGVVTWTVALRKQQVFMTADSEVNGVESSNLAVVTYK